MGQSTKVEKKPKDPKPEAFLKDTLGKRKFSALKKTELDRVILESGVDLTGKVPAEILDMGPQRSRAADIDDKVADECLLDDAGRCSFMRRRICSYQGKALCCEVCENHPINYEGDDGADCPSSCPKLDGEPVCRVCGCSEQDACEGGCSWVEDDLCSACKEKEDLK